MNRSGAARPAAADGADASALRRLELIVAAATAPATPGAGRDDLDGPFGGVARAGELPAWPDIVDSNPNWAWLQSRYGLTTFELDVVLLALATEIDLRYARVFALLEDDSRPRPRPPSVDLLLTLLTVDTDDKLAHRGVFAPDAPLLRHRVLRVVAAPGWSGSLLPMGVEVDAQIVDVLLGGTGLDARLEGIAELTRPGVDDTPTALPAAVFEAVSAAWGSRPLRLYFHGPARLGQAQAAAALAARVGAPLLTVHADRLAPGASLDEQLAVALREALLQGALLFVDAADALTDGGLGTLEDRLAGHGGVVVLSGTATWVPSRDHSLGMLVVPFAVPDAAARRSEWARALAAHEVHVHPADLTALAGRFGFSTSQIHDAVQTATNTVGSAGDLVPRLFAAARAQSGAELRRLARKIEPSFGWADIVLPADVNDQLRELCSRVSRREQVMDEWGYGPLFVHSRGVTALFSGPPGTGKTMAAEVVAAALGVDLYQIDLSSVVSKYIGETEKNLERIFAAAPQANACLLFDEADALFGKRSAVRDAHDRYANQEVSYLLQRMDSYDGVAILTTNRRDHLDDAFIRRLQFIVEFPVPGETERLRIWQARFPAAAPLDPALDLAQLARAYVLPGANISNIALRAAYLAAEARTTIGPAQVTAAVHSEYRKMGRTAPLFGGAVDGGAGPAG